MRLRDTEKAVAEQIVEEELRSEGRPAGTDKDFFHALGGWGAPGLWRRYSTIGRSTVAPSCGEPMAPTVRTFRLGVGTPPLIKSEDTAVETQLVFAVGTVV